MTTTGLQLRQRMIRNARGALGFNGKSTALAGGTDRLRDALRFDMNTLPVDDESGAFIRITQCFSGTATGSAGTTLTDSTASFGSSTLIGALVTAHITAYGATTVLTITSNTGTVLTGSAGWSNGTPATTSAYTVTYGHVAKVVRVDSSVGDIYFDPAVTTAVASGTQYEFWYHGIRPSEVDESRDLALTTRTSPWRLKPLSVTLDVTEWTDRGSSETLAVVENGFPDSYFDRYLSTANNGVANGHVDSPFIFVRPSRQYRLFGQGFFTDTITASVRVRDVTNGADITLTGPSAGQTLQYFGWRWFEYTFTTPATCGWIEIWLGGTSGSSTAAWQGLGLIPQDETWFPLADRVISEHDVGPVYQFSFPSDGKGQVNRQPLQAMREASGAGTALVFDSPPTGPVYYKERHRYSALQSDYMSLADRATGDATSTDCNIDYAAWATTVELLEARKRNADLDRLLTVAYKNLRTWDRRVGADPVVVPEFNTQSSIRVLGL